tara:strand:+ start:390 stop:803 length:414 start_codon:yes stop_codon:yes gene_type:complete
MLKKLMKMRIKKKYIIEGLHTEEDDEKLSGEIIDSAKALKEKVDKADDEEVNDEGVIGGVETAIKDTTSDLKTLGIENPGNVATKLVSSKLNDITESVRPSMTKSELIESVNDINKEIIKSSRKVIKTLKVKDLRNE